MKLYTGSFDNCKKGNLVAISDLFSDIKTLDELVPKGEWVNTWKSGIGKLSPQESIIFYVEKYYETVLSHEEKILPIFSCPDGTILISSEPPEQFSPREVLGAFLELTDAIEVREVKVLDSLKLEVLKRNKYYDLVKSTIRELIKKDIEMYGFQSIAAAKAYSIAREIEKDETGDHVLTSSDYKSLAQILEKEYEDKNIRNRR